MWEESRKADACGPAGNFKRIGAEGTYQRSKVDSDRCPRGFPRPKHIVSNLPFDRENELSDRAQVSGNGENVYTGGSRSDELAGAEVYRLRRGTGTNILMCRYTSNYRLIKLQNM